MVQAAAADGTERLQTALDLTQARADAHDAVVMEAQLMQDQ
jgi:hypothetical protein